MAAKHSRIWPQMALFVLLTVGAATIWGFASAFVEETFFQQSGASSYDQLVINAEGKPWIRQVYFPSFRELPFRTLDGDEAPRQDMPTLRPAVLRRKAPAERRWFHPPVPWGQRLTWASDGQGATWYLVRESGENSPAYFAGFDEASRMAIGFIGRKGFRSDPPRAEERFLAGATVGRNLGLRGDRSVNVSIPVYLLDESRLVEVDLRTRRVRTLLDAPDAESISFTVIARPLPSGADDDQGDDFELLTRLAVRLSDRVAVLKPTNDERIDFALPQQLRDLDEMRFYAVGEDEAVVDVWRGDRPPYKRHLVWISRDGEVAREEDVELAGDTPPSDRHQANAIAAVVPIPLLLGAIELGLGPLGKMSTGYATTYGEGLRQTMTAFWPATLAVCVFSAAAAWAVVRRQRRYGRPRTGLWAALVFLLGLPGLIAYLVQHRRAPVGACAACGRETPRNRDACATCGGAFPEPRLTGVEVFA